MIETKHTGSSPVVTTKREALKAATRANPKPVLHTPAKTTTPVVTPAKTTAAKGVKSIVATLTPTELAAEVKALLVDLAKETDGEEKKKIRRKLRIRGHKGGLNEETKAQTVAKTEAKK